MVAEGFCRGERALTAEELAVRVGIPSRLTHGIIGQLQRLGLLIEVVTPADRAAAFQLARAPETIVLADLFDGLRHDGPPLPPRQAGNGLRVVEALRERLARARVEALGADLAGPGRRGSAGEVMGQALWRVKTLSSQTA